MEGGTGLLITAREVSQGRASRDEELLQRPHEVARAMRANRGRGFKLVALSGYAQAEDVKRALEAGFDAHGAKPPDPDRIAGLLA